MGDMGDMFREHREHKAVAKKRYQDNYMPRDLALIDRLEGVTYEIFNGGEHYALLVETSRGPTEVDYWPSTGRWRSRRGKAVGYGMRSMKNYYRLFEVA